MKAKKQVITTVIGLAVLLLSLTYLDDVLQKLNVTQEDAEYYIQTNFEKGELNYPSSEIMKSILPENRAAIVSALGAYLKAYTASAAFKTQYLRNREDAKPQNAKDILAKELAEVKKNRAEVLKSMEGATGPMKELGEASLKTLDEQQQSLENPGNPSNPMYLAGILGAAIADEETYQSALKKFEEDHPANIQALVKKRLQQFLDLTADIDFDAKLVQENGQLVFEDPSLEAKSYHWKLCYRSGRETIAAARNFAQQWLAELK